MRLSYDTSVKHLVRLGLSESIPQILLKAIPSSNIYRWKYEKPDKYVGCDLNGIAREKLELLQQFSRHQKAQKLFISYLRLVSTYKRIVRQSSEIKKLLFDSRELLCDVIQQVRPALGLEKASRFFGLSVSTLHNWILECKVKCSYSYFQFCNRIRPYQLTRQEVLRIKSLLSDERFQYWPLASIAHYASNQNIVQIGLSTFYKYTKLLGYKRKKLVKPKYPEGIRATYPHQYWHADVTHFKVNHVKYYLYFLADNYSRCLIHYKLEKTLRGLTVKEMLSEAVDLYKPHKATLITDGGCENNNRHVEELLNYTGDHLKHLIAKRDIDFSNSLVEAINKIIKNDYLHQMNISSEAQLRENLDFAITNYNTIRPHYALEGNTPAQALSGKLTDKAMLKAKRIQARIDRLAVNRKNTCEKCL